VCAVVPKSVIVLAGGLFDGAPGEMPSRSHSRNQIIERPPPTTHTHPKRPPLQIIEFRTKIFGKALRLSNAFRGAKKTKCNGAGVPLITVV
jgi:hypothetical protein